jgi:predicted ATPase
MGDRVQSPTLVGRVEEVQTLEAARRRAADGEPAVVLVGGEAGVGKTRLIADLTARCAADGMRVLYGGCVPVGGDGLPYAPIVEALRPLLDALGIDTVRGLVGPSWRELARLLPSLGEPEPGPAGQAAQARLFELLLGLLARLSRQTPLAIVVEDLHWSDQSTRDLLAFLVRNLRRNRVLVVVTYRSDEPGQQRLGAYLAELDRGGRVVRIELARLDQVQTAAQLVSILGTAPAADLVAAVFGRSEGNPLFTEELLAAVRAGSGELPPTLRDLLRGRVQALPERAQQVLAVAAVAGRRVPHRLLASVAGLDSQDLLQALRAAVAHQLLVARPGEDSYQFRHALLREVVDADLLPGERAHLHAAYANALTKRPGLAGVSPAVLAAELAIHWEAAGEVDQALPARVEAGLAAERARAFAEADRHYQRALELWEQVADPGRPAGLDWVDLLTRAAEATSLTGTTERAIGLLERALNGVDRAAEPVRAATLLGLGASPAAELVGAVFARSEGNPFFTEELLAVVRAGSGGLPATLRDLLRGRVQELPEPAHHVLKVVAVAGRQVPHGLLATVAGLTDRQLDGALRAAVVRQLLVARPGPDGYEVRHALLREVVDADLLPGERARLHAGLAHAFSEQPEVTGVSPAVATAELAVHWDAAGEAAEALPARVRAGQAAERAHAFPEARDHYERALDLWERVSEPGRPAGLDRVDLLDHTAQAAISTGAVGRAIELVEDAVGRVEPADEPVRAAVLLARLGDHRRVAGNETGALATTRKRSGCWPRRRRRLSAPAYSPATPGPWP